MDFFYSIVSFFASGGIFMYPILIVFAVGVAIAVERYFTLTMVTNKNRVVWDKVQPLLSDGQFDEAREMTNEDDSTISQENSCGSKGVALCPTSVMSRKTASWAKTR